MAEVATGLTASEYEVSGLEYGQTYEWQVTAVSPDGLTNAGPVWTFTIADGLTVIPNVWYVAPAGDDVTGTGAPANPFASLQEAADAAADGDEIRLASGTYSRTSAPSTVIGAALSISGGWDPLTESQAADPVLTVLQQSGATDRTLMFSGISGDVSLANLTVEGAVPDTPGTNYAVWHNSGNLVLQSVRILGGRVAGQTAAAVYVRDDGRVTIRDSEIEAAWDAEPSFAYGLQMTFNASGASAEIENTVFRASTGVGTGFSAVRVDDAVDQVHVTGSTFHTDAGDADGHSGHGIESGTQTTVKDSEFVESGASSAESAIRIFGGSDHLIEMNNVVLGPRSFSSEILEARDVTGTLTIRDNTLQRVGDIGQSLNHGILLSNLSAVTDLEIARNFVRLDGAAATAGGTAYGIFVGETPAAILLDSNGVVVDGASQGGLYGIRVDGSPDVRVLSNSVYLDPRGTNAGARGIYVNSADADVDMVTDGWGQIRNNVVAAADSVDADNALNAAFFLVGSPNTASDNISGNWAWAANRSDLLYDGSGYQGSADNIDGTVLPGLGITVSVGNGWNTAAPSWVAGGVTAPADFALLASDEALLRTGGDLDALVGSPPLDLLGVDRDSVNGDSGSSSRGAVEYNP